MYDISQFLLKGKDLEQKIIQNLNNAISGSRVEDMKKGIDFKVSYNFDVKSAKKIRRKDEFVSYNKTWLEYRNVNGKNGSLLKPDLDYFIFERENSWEIRNRKKTLEFFLLNCRFSNGKAKPLLELTWNTEIQMYQPYRRKGRQDVIMLVEFDEKYWTADLVIPKNALTL